MQFHNPWQLLLKKTTPQGMNSTCKSRPPILFTAICFSVAPKETFLVDSIQPVYAVGTDLTRASRVVFVR